MKNKSRKNKEYKEMTKEELQQEYKDQKNMVNIFLIFILIFALLSVVIDLFVKSVDFTEVIAISALMLTLPTAYMIIMQSIKTELRIREVIEELRKEKFG